MCRAGSVASFAAVRAGFQKPEHLQVTCFFQCVQVCVLVAGHTDDDVVDTAVHI
jgi:hypothetical protein